MENENKHQNRSGRDRRSGARRWLVRWDWHRSRRLAPQGTAPYYEVAEINVKDQAGYEKSGVDKVRDAIKANGGKVIAGS